MAKHKSKEERFAQIMEAAFICFSEKGFDKTSLQEIADMANVSKGAIFYHFENKKALIMALIENFFEKFINDIIVYFKENQDKKLIILIEDMFKNYMKSIDEIDKYFKLILEFWSHSAADEDIHNNIIKYYGLLTDNISEYFKLAINRGEINNYNPKHIAIILANIMDMIAFDYMYLSKEIDIIELKDTLMQMLKSWLIKN